MASRARLVPVVVMLFIGTAAAAAPARPVHPFAPAVAATEQTPAARAKATGREVEVPERTTPTTRVVALPGGAFRLTQSAVPVRGRTAAGWAPVDTTLERHGGMLRPKVAATPLTFSGGGTGPLVTLGQNGYRLALTFPGRLPTPRLDGDTATYQNVLPGVDLRMTALPQGYSQVLVVGDRSAAKEVTTLDFGLEATGVTVTARADGVLVATDAAGQLVFQAPASAMWDSGGRRTVAGVEIARNTLRLTPDRTFLDDENTRYPVSIDPAWMVYKGAWTRVYSNHPNDSYWNGALDPEQLGKVGYNGWDPEPDGFFTSRTYFQFDLPGLAGKEILEAEINALLVYTPSCTPTPVELWETRNIDPGTTWNRQPAWMTNLGSRSAAAGYSQACAGGRWLGWDARQAVLNSLAGPRGVAVMLKAPNEGDKYQWKKFDVWPTLNVVYNTPPVAPHALGQDGIACAIVPGQPYLAETQPTLGALGSDPDGNDVSVLFEYWFRNGFKTGESRTLFQPNNSWFAIKPPPNIYHDGDTMAWRAIAFDGISWSPWSSWCDVTVDQTEPSKAPMVTSTDYPQNDGGEIEVGLGIGRTGRFAVSANGVSDVVGFKWGPHQDPQTFAAADRLGGAATIEITPQRYGLDRLFVRSVDRAGNPGPLYMYLFFVGGVTPPKAYWRLDGLWPQTDAPDGTGHGFDATLTNGATAAGHWAVGRVDDAVWLNGTSASVLAKGGPVVDTSKTFTVSAWARPAVVGSTRRTVVSQDGATMSAFYLEADPADRKWRFTMFGADATPETGRAAAASDEPLVEGRWTHLVAQYDQAAKVLTLFVDGRRQQATAVQPSAWRATGNLVMGRGKHGGAPGSYWSGGIDDLQVFDRVLSAEEIQTLAGSSTREEGLWALDDGAGKIGSDVSGNRRDAALTGGATWTDQTPHGEHAVRLDGTGALETGVQAVRTDSSYTVSAQVRIDELSAGWQTVVAQEGPRSAGFALQYTPQNKRWAMVASTGDDDLPNWIGAYSSEQAQPGEWTQLTGVYDQPKAQVRLYVNGALAGSAQIEAGARFRAVDGPLVMGRSKQAGQKLAYLKGSVDEVRVFTGVRTDQQIRADASIRPVPPPPVYPGQIAAGTNQTGDRVAALGSLPTGYHYIGPVGVPAPGGAPDTRIWYSCMQGPDSFVSMDVNCEGKRNLGKLATVYQNPPGGGIPVHAVYRCDRTDYAETFLSLDANCEGSLKAGIMGYVKSYGLLMRYKQIDGLSDHRSGAVVMPPSYRHDASLGFVTGDANEPNTTELYSCVDGQDSFSSIDPNCEGKTKLQSSALIWTQPPPEKENVPLYRCRLASGDRFDSTEPNCEGHSLDRQLGYLVIRP